MIGCEPGEVDDVGLGLTPAVEAAVERALTLVRETIDELRTDAAYVLHELSVSAAVVDTAVRHAAGRQVTAVHLRVGALRQVVPGLAGLLLRDRARATRVCEGAVLEQELIDARLRCDDCDDGVGGRRARVPLPGVRRAPT